MTDVKATVIESAHSCGFDLVGVASADDFLADREAALERISKGQMDGLPWYTESRVMRGTSPEELLPGARSIVCLGLSYWAGDPSEEDADSDNGNPKGRVARYAWVRDYHRVMKRRMRDFVLSLDARVSARWYVDDGPMLDRAAAMRGGIGWFGKNTNILNPQFGSWIFLGQVITDLELQPDAPLRKSCGSCVRCIDACPTGAIVAPYVLDNSRCISYLTIENRGPIPREMRPLIGDWVFGCDICQDVCPVNRVARVSSIPIAPSSGTKEGERASWIGLVELLEMTGDEFRNRFAGTSIIRAKHTGMQRNACVALGNAREESAVPALSRALEHAEPVVRAHAAWALGRIGGDAATGALAAAEATEADATVLEEIRTARQDLARG